MICAVHRMAALAALFHFLYCPAAELPARPGVADAESDATTPAGPVALTRRLDERRRDDPYTVLLGGRPLTLTGEYEASIFKRKDFALAPGAKDDVTGLDQELQLEALYSLGGAARIFLEIKGLADTELKREAGGETSDESLERGQMWLYLDGPLGAGTALQLGRQNFRERRSWWWDDDLDALRFHVHRGKVNAEFALAREVAPVSTLGGIDPQEEGVRRLIGHLSWRYLRRHSMELYFLGQRDNSQTGPVGSVIPRDRRDASDGNLRWYGLRASGNVRFGSEGRFLYWLDSAGVRGDELLTEYGTIDSTTSQVRSSRTQRVAGDAFDFGGGLQLDFPARPSLTLGYARASGDTDSGDAKDRAFRQTGLEENKSRLFGVKRFRYYGELTQPSLANLTVLTGTLGVRVTRNTSIDLVYHHYRQTVPATSMRDFRISAPLGGTSRDLGQEIDLVIALRESRRWEFVAIGSAFKAGAAYGGLGGRKAHYAELSATYNF